MDQIRPSGPPGIANSSAGWLPLETVDQVREELAELAFKTIASVRSLEPYSSLSEEYIATARPLDRRTLRRGITVRSVVRTEALQDASTREYLEELSSLGANIRHVRDLHEHGIAFDEHAAIVAAPAVEAGRHAPAILLEDPCLMMNFLQLFDRVWETADPILFTASPQNPLSPDERDALSAMVKCSKDSAAAHMLNVSLRTYRRRIASCIDKMQSQSRLEAALKAREHGLI